MAACRRGRAQVRRHLVGVPARRRRAARLHAARDLRDKLDFDRYWYSEEIAEARALASGLFQVPVLPTYHEITGLGALQPDDALP